MGAGTFVIWNPEKVQAHNLKKPTTYRELVAIETETQSSWSSVVTTQDISALVQAFENEADTTILIHKIED